MKRYYQHFTTFCLGGAFIYPFCGYYEESVAMCIFALIAFLLSRLYK